MLQNGDISLIIYPVAATQRRLNSGGKGTGRTGQFVPDQQLPVLVPQQRFVVGDQRRGIGRLAQEFLVDAALLDQQPCQTQQQQHILSRPYRQPFIGFGGGTGQAGVDDDDLHAAFPGIGAGVIQPAGELFGLEIVAAKIEQKVALFYIGKKAVITPGQFVGDMPGGLAGRCAADQIRGAEGLDEGLGELVADQIFAMAMLPDQFPRIVVSYGL